MKRYLLRVVAFLLLFHSHSAFGLPFPDPVVPKGFGVCMHLGQLLRPTELQALADGGIRFVRTDLFWSEVEKKPGKYDFSRYQNLVEGLSQKGIRPLFILDYRNPLYDRGGRFFPLGPAGDKTRTAFAAYAATAAKCFKAYHPVWEIWNEPNIKLFWKPQPDAADYMALVRSTVAAIKKVDPDGIVIGPALASESHNSASFLKECFRLGLLNLVDGISVHPYRRTAPETVSGYYEEVRQWMGQYTPAGKGSIPIICSEWGYSATNFPPEKQADYTVRSYLVNLSEGVPLTLWYDWRNDGTNPENREHNFGLLRYDFTPKPSYFSLQKMNRELGGYNFVRRLRLSDKEDWALLFENGQIRKVAFWTSGEPHKSVVAISPGGPRFEVSLSSTPQYRAIP